MEFLPEDIDRYAHNHTSAENQLLAELNRETHAKILKPRMLSGHLQGRVLSLISKLHRPQRILEIGTYTGYAAICMAEGLAKEGILHTIDINEELEDFARGYFDKSDFGSQIIQHVGHALDIIPTLQEKWDLVFIDADKEHYLDYYELVMKQMNPGGLILCDNVLWSGKIVDAKAQDKDTVALRELNERVHADARVENVLLPIRDGVMAARVLS